VIIRVPSSTANLGPGFDSLACALQWYVEVQASPTSAGAEPVDVRHPARVAWTRAGGVGPLWVPSSLPMARGLGSSAALRLAGVIAALVQRHGPEIDPRDPHHGALDLVSELEGHTDNAAAALYGGLVVSAGGDVVRVPMARLPTVVVWVPDVTTRTSASRRSLPDVVPFDDAVFTLGRAALLVAAMASGTWEALATATEDRLHQTRRLERHPWSQCAIDSARQAGAWGAWLSGSGPSVACWCDESTVEAVVAALPPQGRTRVLGIDLQGAMILPDD
jgi:homoserine kinase